MSYIKNSVAGRYTVTLTDGAGNVKFESSFENLITDAGLNHMATVSNSGGADFNTIFRYAYLGTGTTEPQPTDTTITNQSASSSSGTLFSAEIVNVPDRHKRAVVQYAFNPGVATGTWSEVGIRSSSGGLVLSKTLIKDSGGAPTTIVKDAADYLYIRYEIKQFTPMSDIVGELTLDGMTYSYTARPFNAVSSQSIYFVGWSAPSKLTNPGIINNSNNYANAYNQAVLSDPMQTPGVNGGVSTTIPTQLSVTHYANQPFADILLVIDPSSANMDGGIRLLTVGGKTSQYSDYAGYQISFDPPLPKNSDIGITLTFRWVFSRA